MSREKELNSLLVEAEDIYNTLESAGIDLADLDGSAIPKDKLCFFSMSFYILYDAINGIARLLKRVHLDTAIQNADPERLKFYRDKLLPNRKGLERLIMRLLDLPDTELSSKEMLPFPTGNPVWNVLVSGLDYWEDNYSDEFTKDDIESAERLLYSSFFRPDEWLKNADDIEPIFGKAAENTIPSNVRIRLKELYRSFILGNHLSAIALARAILEYALIDKSAKLGINAFSSDPRYPNRTRKLGMLVEDAAEKRPELEIDMESIVEAGNQTMHPRKGDNLVLLPNALRKLAFTSICSVRRVIEDLYIDQGEWARMRH
jgi:hypothetical protein